MKDQDTLLFIAGIIFINAIIAHFVGEQGRYRRIGYNNAVIASFLLTPLFGLLFVIASLPLPIDKSITLDKNEDREKNIKKWMESNPNKTLTDFYKEFPE